jgi:hemerythrin superfamily protein
MAVNDHEHENTGATAILTTDHHTMAKRFRALEAPGLDPAARRDLLDQAIIELVQHSVAEELFLYPAVREYVPGGAAQADHQLENHAEAERVMKILEDLDPQDVVFEPQLARLATLFDAHVAYEEGGLFPTFDQACAADFREAIGEQILISKSYGPTRPHPDLPDTPPGNKILALGTGLVDRARDTLSHRGQDH